MKDGARKQYCELIVRDDAVFVFATVGTGIGSRLLSQPVTKLARDVAAEQLGRAVLNALAAYRANAPSPDAATRKALDAELLKGTGYKSWRALDKNAARVDIQFNGTDVVITPSAANGRGGYMGLVADAIRAQSDPLTVGEAVIGAIARCVTKSKLP